MAGHARCPPDLATWEQVISEGTVETAALAEFQFDVLALASSMVGMARHMRECCIPVVVLYLPPHANMTHIIDFCEIVKTGRVLGNYAAIAADGDGRTVAIMDLEHYRQQRQASM